MSVRPMSASESQACPPFEYLVSRYPGVKAISDECSRIYPDQLNPLQVQSVIKSWRGGPDPLDYISMFDNKGNYSIGVPPHWHYVSYGLSDLHCDGRLFSSPLFGPEKSGFGIELTFRLLKIPGESNPPTWPAHLMQGIARYVYNHGYPLMPGDHMSWHQPMNIQDPESNPSLRQILVTSDAQLQNVTTPSGSVEFVQIIPVTTEELIAVQKWNVKSFLELMKQIPQCGGSYLVTDMSRIHTCFMLVPEMEEKLIEGIAKEGSNLSGVNALGINWTPDAWKYYDDNSIQFLSPEYQQMFYYYYGPKYNRSARPDPYNNHISHMDESTSGASVPMAMCSPSLECLDDYRSPPSVESNSSHESHSQDSDNHSSDETEQRLKTNYDGATDNDMNALAAAFSGMNKNLLAASNFEPSDENQDEASSLPQFSKAFLPTACSPRVTYFDLLHITVQLEAGFCFPLALTGRLRFGRHFSFNGFESKRVITLVPPEVKGSFVTAEKPFGEFGRWLQIYMSKPLVNDMIRDFNEFLSSENVVYPKTFLWPERKFGLTLIL